MVSSKQTLVGAAVIIAILIGVVLYPTPQPSPVPTPSEVDLVCNRIVDVGQTLPVLYVGMPNDTTQLTYSNKSRVVNVTCDHNETLLDMGGWTEGYEPVELPVPTPTEPIELDEFPFLGHK